MTGTPKTINKSWEAIKLEPRKFVWVAGRLKHNNICIHLV